MDLIEGMIEQLGSDDEVLRVQAGESLLLMGRAAVRPLINALENRSYKGRHLIAATLGCLGDARAVEPLIRALRDPDKTVRYHSALALGKLRDKRAVQPLIYALFDEMPPLGPDSLTGEILTVRGAAALALGDLQAVEAVEPLKVLLRSELKSVRNSAVHALGRIPSEEALKALADHLTKETEEEVKKNILRGLKKFPLPEGPLVLSRILSQAPGPEVEETDEEDPSGQGSSPDPISAPAPPQTRHEKRLLRLSAALFSGKRISLLFALATLAFILYFYQRSAGTIVAVSSVICCYLAWRVFRRRRASQSPIGERTSTPA